MVFTTTNFFVRCTFMLAILISTSTSLLPLDSARLRATSVDSISTSFSTGVVVSALCMGRNLLQRSTTTRQLIRTNAPGVPRNLPASALAKNISNYNTPGTSLLAHHNSRIPGLPQYQPATRGLHSLNGPEDAKVSKEAEPDCPQSEESPATRLYNFLIGSFRNSGDIKMSPDDKKQGEAESEDEDFDMPPGLKEFGISKDDYDQFNRRRGR